MRRMRLDKCSDCLGVLVPAPRRGELARVLGQELRAAKDELGRLVTIEVGKIASDLALQFRTA